MLPRLAAEESIRSANQIAVGTGSLEPEAQQKLMRGWEKQTHPAHGPKKATARDLASMGIKVRVVPKTG